MLVRSLNLLFKFKYSVIISSGSLRRLDLNVALFKNAYSSMSQYTELCKGVSSNVFFSCLKLNLQPENQLNKGSDEIVFFLENSLDRKLIFKSVSSNSPECFKEGQTSEPNAGIIGQCHFIKNEDDAVVVYIDGACLNNGKADAKAGLGVWFNHEHPLNVSAPVKGRATNNNAEIQAAKEAIVQAHRAGVSRLCINTDSKFVISCITDWIHKWKLNGWKLANGRPVKNKEELLELDHEVSTMEHVAWHYVAAHKGIDGNRMADKLARQGAAQYVVPECESP